MPRTVFDAEQHALMRQRVLDMIRVLVEAIHGRITRADVVAWSRTIWPNGSGQGGPFRRHGTASTVFDSIYNLDRDDVVREHDLRAYVRWLAEGEALQPDDAPIAVLHGRPSDWLPTPALDAPVRCWIDGLGWHEGVQLACPATGRPLMATSRLEPSNSERAVSIMMRAGDDAREAVLDLFETFAIDERDVVYLDPRVQVATLPVWQLWRLDDNGNEFQMETFRSRAKALETQARFEARGHRQSYFVRPAPP